MTSFLKIDWGSVERLAYILAKQARDYKPDAIVGISRGGFIPAVLVADELGVSDVYAVNIKYYTGLGSTRSIPEVHQRLDTDYLEGRRALIVDDLVDKGHTMSSAFDTTKEAGAKEIRTAALLYKPPSPAPDYYAEKTSDWVVFPWERRESTQWVKEQETQI